MLLIAPAWYAATLADLTGEPARTERGPGVVFAYYQSGLLCQMLIEEHGFAPMVRLLESFDRGADLDRALRASG